MGETYPGTKIRSVRVDDERWTAFLEACEEEGTNASKQVRDMIDVWLEGLD